MTEFEENTGLKITFVTFDGSNYLSSSNAMDIALCGRGRIGFLDGSIPASDSVAADYAEWRMNDRLVMSWLINSIDIKLHSLFNFSVSSKDLWDSIKELYSHQENLYRVFELKKAIADLNKEDKPFIEFLSNLRTM